MKNIIYVIIILAGFTGIAFADTSQTGMEATATIGQRVSGRAAVKQNTIEVKVDSNDNTAAQVTKTSKDSSGNIVAEDSQVITGNDTATFNSTSGASSDTYTISKP